MHAKYHLITTHLYKLRNNSQHHSIKMTVILGMETTGKTQDGKTGATVRYIFNYEKIWNVTITANSPKPGECSTRQNHWENPS